MALLNSRLFKSSLFNAKLFEQGVAALVPINTKYLISAVKRVFLATATSRNFTILPRTRVFMATILDPRSFTLSATGRNFIALASGRGFKLVAPVRNMTVAASARVFVVPALKRIFLL